MRPVVRDAVRARLRERFQRRLLGALTRVMQAKARNKPPRSDIQREQPAAPDLVQDFTELADGLAVVATTYVELLVEDPRHQIAVLDRAELVEGWDLMSHGVVKLPSLRLMHLAGFLGIMEQAAGVPVAPWPSNVSQDDVSTAVARATITVRRNPERLGVKNLRELEVVTPDLPPELVRELGPGPGIPPAKLSYLPWPLATCAHVVSIAKRVDEDRRQQAIAIDAGTVHHDIVTGMRDMPKDRVKHTGAALTAAPPQRGPDGIHRVQLIGVPHRKRSRAAAKRAERFEVIAPGLAVQVAFPFDERASVSVAMIETLKRWRGPLNTWKGPAGLRHWAALLRMLSIEGAREGHVRWTMERHLDAIGASEDARHDVKYRQEIGSIVELLTRLELAVYAPDGTLRLRQSILSSLGKIDKKHGSTWALEGMDLHIHPLLYDGVRKASGEPGTNWFPQAADLAKIDHVRFPNAIALGLMLPIRWRWDWGDGRDHTTLSGAKLLEAAGVSYKLRHIGEAWRKLKRTLDKLVTIEALGRYEWEGDAWTLGALCHLYPPQWACDRTFHALPPVEPSPAAFRVPMTGAELVAWRKKQNLTQAAAATRLGVSERTIRNAENAEAAQLGPALRKAFTKLAG
jgi:DNA-binding XRE family transcriptional regulator